MDTLTIKCTDVPQFDALIAAAEAFRTDDKLHLRTLCNDSARCTGLTATHITHPAGTITDVNNLHNVQRRIILDYSRQRVTGETMELLFDLADAVGFNEKREAMRRGMPINTTEGKPVLHHALRMPNGHRFDDCLLSSDEEDAGDALLKQIHDVRDRIQDFSDRVRSGQLLGATDKRLSNK